MAKKSWLERLKREPKFSTRKVNRCFLCGRTRSFICKFGICRMCFRHLAHNGQLPGVKKASW